MIVVKDVHADQQTSAAGTAEKGMGRAAALLSNGVEQTGHACEVSPSSSMLPRGIAGASLFGAAVITDEQTLVADDSQRRTAVTAVGHVRIIGVILSDSMSGTVHQKFSAALDDLVAQIKEDRSILAVILCGSLSHDTVWAKSDIDLVLVRLTTRRSMPRSISLYADGA
jgi:hypothetical protein